MSDKPNRDERGARSLDDFLDLDEKHVAETRRWLFATAPDIRAALDQAWSLFDTLRRAGSQYATDEEDDRRASELGERLKVDDARKLLALVKADADAPIGSDDVEAIFELRVIAKRFWSRNMRAVLVLMCQRLFAWAVGDLFRRHFTPVKGQLRVQAEAAALAFLMKDNGDLAKQWFDIRDEDDGKRFFRHTRGDIERVLTDFGLLAAYQRGSGIALHARAFSVVGSFAQHSYVTADRRVREVSLGFHEGEEESVEMRFLHLLDVVRAQAGVLRLLFSAYPEVDDPIVLGAHLPRLDQTVRDLFARFDKTFPDFVKRVRERKARGDDGT